MSEDTNVVKTEDVAKTTPTSFRDLKKPELVAAAKAFGTEEEGNVQVLRADLEANGVTWEMYAKAFQLEGYEKVEEPQEAAFPPPPLDAEDWEDGGEEEVEIVTLEEVPTLAPKEKYLVKFIGENPYFEFGKYKFTQEKPYGIMPAEDAQKALVNEPTKFRQAFPAELQEFYG